MPFTFIQFGGFSQICDQKNPQNDKTPQAYVHTCVQAIFQKSQILKPISFTQQKTRRFIRSNSYIFNVNKRSQQFYKYHLQIYIGQVETVYSQHYKSI